ncbi:hypothetical protein FOXG_22135 [Fusarium oxysporum f. sp. lycopersici 4287]|uniref:Uncharacterized protein n=2 Tax=Fusarium oxysporum TaxID=5507 RepID=A0A0J9W5K1_FUSO4|nr:hypothetical protein FOXG_22135 [Fusarium oxysporum f. sp. lycopersici 4287]EXK26652.1 hypothetical protein FOMG_16714 [Fusarium oxysporum f. sp. melonis 26406]KNB18153.1 hypothetical protein FOXG_22135 [Fusarium oxysporum f. sp. lycopersici 4287]
METNRKIFPTSSHALGSASPPPPNFNPRIKISASLFLISETGV